MDPIIAGSLVSVGKNFIQGLSNRLTSGPEVKPLGQNSFSQELNKVSSTDSVEKTTMDTKTLHASLLDDPQVSSFVENNKDCQIAVKQINFCLKMQLEIKLGSGFGGHTYNNTYTYARSSAIGPGPGEEDFKAHFAIDLTKIKYDVIKEKKPKKGKTEIRTVGPQN